jgi:hypothetical protein
MIYRAEKAGELPGTKVTPIQQKELENANTFSLNIKI